MSGKQLLETPSVSYLPLDYQLDQGSKLWASAEVEYLDFGLPTPHTHFAKPFVKWVGGKGQLLHEIAPYIIRAIKHEGRTEYIEPFVGGGAMLFHILNECPEICSVRINDINPKLINCYRVIRDTPKLLVDLLSDYQSEYYSLESEERKKEYYLTCRTRFNQSDRDKIEEAALFILINRTCFNGLYRVNKRGEYNVPFGRAIQPKICDADTIYADSKALQKVEIMLGDYSEAIKNADETSVVYFDPPYKPLNATSNFNSYSKEDFGDQEQERLKTQCDLLDEHGALFALSNSDALLQDGTSYFDALYQGYVVERVFARRAVNAQANKRGKITEVFIRNF